MRKRIGHLQLLQTSTPSSSLSLFLLILYAYSSPHLTLVQKKMTTIVTIHDKQNKKFWFQIGFREVWDATFCFSPGKSHDNSSLLPEGNFMPERSSSTNLCFERGGFFSLGGCVITVYSFFLRSKASNKLFALEMTGNTDWYLATSSRPNTHCYSWQDLNQLWLSVVLSSLFRLK